ncbi:MAG: hypothetical protein A2W05_05640 [Candidatus Schekmanbacteria bacterium RBG_16_38_10]|uniref:Tyr recombinase domain-containing protein n=1 Tax=Candidatus Schekmanbacteria bacterium RBG_16_38_10 TaxID=1817879 RepID=A0A1F7RWB2_9BACT|nr:MAG: hypothetical protein A2W05_05640 [Candidatus Schekmanbacteria bacterium RBG_16_38_10]
MKKFKSFLSSSFQEYISYRQTIGYRGNNIRSNLLHFDQYVKEKNADENSFNPLFFIELSREFKQHLTPASVNQIIGTVRGFFQFIVRKNIYAENPLQDIPGHKENAYIPFIFSTKEIKQLLSAVQERIRKSQKHFLYDLSEYIAILLLAECGLRISEPLRLLHTHYRKDDGTIYIEKTKFRKDRLIPLPKSVLTEIENYLAVRKSLLTDDKNQYLLAGSKTKKIDSGKIYRRFHQAVKDIGITEQKQIIADTTFGAPTPHSLRHSFAINTLKRIKERGKSTQEALPVLAVHMGHVMYQYTSLYLKVLDAEHRQGLVNFALSQLKKV